MPKAATSRAGWTTVAFGDVVRLSTERSSNPESDGFERFVGLEHIEPGDLRIRRWGDIADGTTFTSVFRPGQVLFGKRRAYQRKVAVADFSGICSGDIYVFEPKNNGLLPELLPLICQTDAFFEHAVGTSTGSLSPRTNWTSLSEFQFALPPIEEQRRIAGLFQAVDVQARAVADLQAALVATRLAWLDNVTKSLLAFGSEMRLADACSNVTDGAHKTPTYVADGVPFLRVTDIQSTCIDWDQVKRIPEHEHAELCQRCNPEPGDVLLSKNGTIGITKVIDWDIEFSIFVSLCLLKPRPIIKSEYLKLMVESPHAARQLFLRVKQGTVKNLHLEEIRECRIPVPDGDTQRSIVEQSGEFTRLQAANEHRIGALANLKSRLLDRILGRGL